jgi:type I restriction enzyme M protein
MTKDQFKQLEKDLWLTAERLWALSGLKPSEYSSPVLGIIFLRFADNNYRRHEAEIVAEFEKKKGTRVERPIEDIAMEKCGFYLPEKARYDYLLNLPGSADVAKAIKEAMKLIEKYKPELEDVLPVNDYAVFNRTEESKQIPNQLLRSFADIDVTAGRDLFGQIYEYFLGKFASSEGQKGGEFFTPRTVVRLMVEMIQPHGGRVFDPACGSGGMFVQSAHFIDEHRQSLKGGQTDVFVCGQEKTRQTVSLAKMNLAVNGLRGEIREANTYSDDPFNSFGQFDYILANPPFNVDEVPIKTVEKDPRFNTYGLPRNKSKVTKDNVGKETVPNANYLWISLFATSLKDKGRAALVMANSASDARHSEADIRRKLIEENLIAGMLTLPSNMFYTVTLPATLWFFDKGKTDDRILFIDARNIFTPIDRVHREFSEEQVQNIALINRLHKGQRAEFTQLIDRYFAQGMERLIENEAQVQTVSAQLLEVLDDADGKAAVKDLVKQWAGLEKLRKRYDEHQERHAASANVDMENRAQHKLRESFDPFFTALHDGLRHLDKIIRQHEKAQAEAAKAEGKRGSTDKKTRALKTALEALHGEVKEAESFFQHIHWLQERFPKAEYEDVTGLCKLATPAEVAEQDWSLNPGRYVGVVIEEDGKTEAEFRRCIEDLKSDITIFAKRSRELEEIVEANTNLLLSAL